MKPKVALVKDGFIDGDHTWSRGDENKRGRLSKPAIERCKVLASEGWDIDGYTVSQSVSGESTVSKVKSDPNAVSEIPPPTRDETTMTAWVGDKSVGMRTVCNNCRRSLPYCLCEQPKVWLDHINEGVVRFKSAP